MFEPTDRRRFLQSALGAAAAMGSPLAAMPALAAASNVFYGYPPGSPGAVVAGMVLRAIQGRYQPDLGADLSYLPGNSGARAQAAALKGPADGSTVLYGPSTGLTLLPHVRPQPGVDLANDFIAVAPLVEFTFAFTVGPAVPANVRTMPEYVRWVRDNSQLAGYGLPGLGTAPHFAGMLIALAADLPIKPVAYQGLKPMVEDLLNGGVPAAIMVLAPGADARIDPRLRPLAVTSARRWVNLPELPTLGELGLGDADVVETFGLHLPAATPAAKVRELSDAVLSVLDTPALAAYMRNSTMRTLRTTPQAYGEAMREERLAWGNMVKKMRFSMQS